MTVDSMTPEALEEWDQEAHVLFTKLALARKYTEEADAIKASWRKSLGDGEFVVGDYTIVIEPADRLASDFAETHPVEEYPHYYKTVPDTQAIQRDLGKRFHVKATSRVSVKITPEEEL